jgi:hypothetical protein
MSDPLINPNQVFKLRLRKLQVKHDLGLDVIYLFQQHHYPLLPRVFPYSLCIRVTDALKTRLRKVVIDDIEAEPLAGHGMTTVNAQCSLEKAVPLDLCTHLLVPVLALSRKALSKSEKVLFNGARYPAYLMAPQHAKDDGTVAMHDILTDETTLFTPEGPVRPVCLRCPRQLLHLQGKCHLGTKACYDALLLEQPREDQDGQLQADDADGTRVAADATP